MLKKYASYTVEDFVQDEAFIDWVKLCHPEDASVFHDLVKEYPYQAETIAQARQIVLHLDGASKADVDTFDVQEIWEKIDDAISSEKVRIRHMLGRIHYLAAASILFLAGLVWWQVGLVKTANVSTYTSLIREADVPLEEIVNTSNKPLLVKLADGSRVTLDENSRLSFNKDFTGREREVFLSGGAFFDVTKNAERPFVVYANELVTKVLGTSFTIKAFDQDQRVVVSVKSGKVAVFANKNKITEKSRIRSVTLAPNQQAIFLRQKETISRSLVDKPQIVISPEELMHFTFANVQVASIFEALKKAYGVEIKYDEELLSGCRLTTSLTNETLYERLDVICEAIDASYKVVDDQVIVSGKRCN